MKKRIAIVIAAAVLLTGAAALAASIGERIAFERLDKFDKMVKVLEEKAIDDQDFNDMLLSYQFIAEGLNAPQEQLDYIADAVVEGCDFKDIIAIYRFWLDTSEGADIIRGIYELKADYPDDKFWIEDAFNRLTDNKCGVLTEEEYAAYKSLGLTYEDVDLANLMSRKGILTIHQILDRVASGESFEAISQEIYDPAPPVLESGTMARVGSIGRRIGNFSKKERPRERANVSAGRKLAAIASSDIAEYLQAAEEGQDIEELLAEKQNQVARGIIKDLKKRKIFRIIDNEWDRQTINEIKGIGVTGEQIQSFREEGYDLLDILNAANIADKADADLAQLLQRAENGETWDEISREVVSR